LAGVGFVKAVQAGAASLENTLFGWLESLLLPLLVTTKDLIDNYILKGHPSFW